MYAAYLCFHFFYTFYNIFTSNIIFIFDKAKAHNFSSLDALAHRASAAAGGRGGGLGLRCSGQPGAMDYVQFGDIVRNKSQQASAGSGLAKPGLETRVAALVTVSDATYGEKNLPWHGVYGIARLCNSRRSRDVLRLHQGFLCCLRKPHSHSVAECSQGRSASFQSLDVER